MPPSKCAHSQLTFSPSRNALIVKCKQPSFAALTAATTSVGTIKRTSGSDIFKEQEEQHSQSFPASLVFPEDELSVAPKCPPELLGSWRREKERNKGTHYSSRAENYIFHSPARNWKRYQIHEEWTNPSASALGKNPKVKALHSKTRDVLDYLRAFYRGIEGKLLLTPKLEFTADSPPPPDTRAYRNALENIWLNTSKELVGFRLRATPKRDFEYQLNLNTPLDAAIEILSDDAFALVMLVKHDMFEGEEDGFACTRAYRECRVAIVSSLRYNPGLDWKAGVEREHSWPASHCKEYLERVYNKYEVEVGTKEPV